MANDVKAGGIDTTYRSDYQKRSDRANIAGETGSGRIDIRDDVNKASEMADEIAHKPREACGTFKDKATDVGHAVEGKTKRSHRAICDFTKKNPTAAVLTAFGLGAILARVLPGR
ncbi:MAG: hypothetical protein LAT64_03520 [Phycisphaerales bacterium]|nr:hypothetical protein [Planctomycetota bacterium]MCH8507821.1 hypothetical protein [Phycisphaerales bacterium]